MLGKWLGNMVTSLYLGFYHLPHVVFSVPLDTAAAAIVTALIAGVVGGLGAVRSILSMTPAEAMRPPTPPAYHGGRQMPHWLRWSCRRRSAW
jgi:putative ABC transport system permease protein